MKPLRIISPPWLLAAVCASPCLLAAQQPAYNYALTEPDQELDHFSGKFAGLHRFTTRLRGVRGADSTLYWVSTDSKQLTAYKLGYKIWQANVSQAFVRLLPGARINRLALSSHVIFITTTNRGHAEIDRATGVVSALGIDPN